MARSLPTKSCTTCACPERRTADDCAGNWKRPSALWSPPLELKWLAIAKTVLPRKLNSAASGLRLVVQTGLVGSMRPGDRVSAGSPWLLTTDVPVVDRLTESEPRATNETRAGLNRNTTRML